eukprot:COSAG03_NODE_98_length_13005_cov_17.216953_5_plen_253_part_00
MPTKARGLFSKCVALCANATLDADEEVRLRADALTILLPRLLLYPTGAAWWSTTTLKEVRTRCQRFLAYDWRALYADSAPYAPAPFDPQAAAASDAVLRERRLQAERAEARTTRQLQLDHVIQQVSDGLVSKAAQSLMSTGTAPSTQATADKLASLQFPTRPAQHPINADAHAHRLAEPVLTPEQVSDGVRLAPRGSAAGPSGWRFEHVKAACEDNEGQDAIVVIVTRIASGEYGKRTSTHATSHIISRNCQ